MDYTIPGIHHVTAIASDPQRNLDFYTRVLGLRLVKLTVNFDLPDTYHFYFADASGHPGTVLTFFPWPKARKGRQGAGQVSIMAFSVPQDSLGFWADHLLGHGIEGVSTFERFNEEGLSFRDPDGLLLELVAGGKPPEIAAWEGGSIPPEQAIHGFHGVTLLEEGFEATAQLLTGLFGFRLLGGVENRARFEAPSDQPGRRIDLVSLPAAPSGTEGAGTVHHVAWRAQDDAQQAAWRALLVSQGYNVTPVLDRQYFHSIYFREPGGVLFEIATDPPGFLTDESFDCLGSTLKLPPWLESHRPEIERRLAPLSLPRLAPSPCPEPA